MSAWQHPELQPGEVFYKNVPAVAFRECALHTKRMGKVAYWMKGEHAHEPIEPPVLFPVFVAAVELSSSAFLE